MLVNVDNPMLQINLTPELKKSFLEQSKLEDLSMKQLARRIIKEYLAKVQKDNNK